MNCKISCWLTLTSLLGLSLVVGCGDSNWGRMSGTVMLNGEPVGPGTITLRPVDTSQPGAMAFFGEDGKYSVMSAGRKEGALPGEYQVLIQGGTQEDFTSESAGPRPTSKIPLRYSAPLGSDLMVTIEPGSSTTDFDLKP